MTPRTLLLAAALLMPLAVGAEEPAVPVKDAAADTPARTVEQQPATRAADEAAATKQANERFKPSEKISEDLSVSFPADI